jgi:thiol-disulfide isomerase/thioredoxin
VSGGLARRALAAGLLGLLALPGAASAAAPPPAGLVFEPEGPAGRYSAEPLLAAALWDLDNQPTRFRTWAGRPLVVNFWARWCGPCRVEIPELVSLVERRSGVGVLGLNIESDPAPVRDFARAYDVNYPVLLTRGGGIELMRALGNSKAGLPFTVVLDRRGAVVASRLGLLTREQLDAAVERALK